MTSAQAIIHKPLYATSEVPYGYYRFSKNVVIENCYFGKSDKRGHHLIPIGHHGHAYKSAVDSLIVRNCVFDNPLQMAVRPATFSNFVLEGNTFIATEPRITDRADAMITFSFGRPNSMGIHVTDAGHFIQAAYETPYGSEGCLGTLKTARVRCLCAIKGF